MSEVKIMIKPTPKPLIHDLPKEQNISLQLLERKHSSKDYKQNTNLGKSPFDRKPKQVNTEKVFNKKKQKPQRNFFTQQIEQNGPNFIEKMRPFDLSNSCDRIIKELARGKCDISQVGPYIANPLLLNQLIIHSTENYNVELTEYYAFDFVSRTATAQQQQIAPLHVKLTEEHKGKAAIYNACINRLNELKNNGNPEILISLVHDIRPLSKYLK